MAADGTNVGTLQAGGFGTAGGCTFSQNNDGNGAFTGGVNSGSDNMYDCRFTGSLTCGGGASVAKKAYNCVVQGSVDVGGSVDFRWLGGEIQNGLNVHGTNTFAMVSTAFEGGSISLSADSAGNHTIQNTAPGNANLTVTCIVANVSVTGDWTSVTFSGVPAGQRRFNGSCTDMDFTGPGLCVATNTAQSAGKRITLRGAGVKAALAIPKFSLPAIKFLSCTYALVTADIGDIGAGAKAYALDASSNHNLLVLGGTTSAGFTTPSTDLGTGNRVITDAADSYVDTLLTEVETDIVALEAAVTALPDDALLNMGYYT